MDKKSKEALRRYKKARAAAAASSSTSSSSSDSDSGSSSGSYSSSSSEKKAGHRKKKVRDSSSSGDERRKREKAHSCHQKKLEAKRNHLKRKLREAKAAKKRALSANSLRRRVGSASPSKLKVSGEKKHLRTASKERLRHAAEREKLERRAREKERIRSRSPRTLAKLEAKLRARKSPTSSTGRHQMSPREKIIIQTRTRERTPERKRELKIRHDSRERERRDRERAEREAERQKERDEALARCQERQRERERLAREKKRREEYVAERGERLLPRPVERDMTLAVARGYGSRERSLEEEGRIRHGHGARVRDPAYEREREYLAAEHHRAAVLERDERREREYLVVRRRDVLSPGHYRDERDVYSEEERAAYARAYAEEERRRDRNWDPRELELLKERELEKLYPRRADDWPIDERWEEKWGRGKGVRPSSEPDWDAEEYSTRQLWEEAREKRERERALDHVQSPGSSRSGRWPPEWRGGHPPGGDSGHRKGSSFRHGGPHPPADYMHDRQKYRPHPPPLMAIHSGYHPPSRQFPSKRQMTYTNPNLKKKSSAAPTTPGGTAIPSLLALPPIPPPDTTIDEPEQPLVSDIIEPIPIVPLNQDIKPIEEESKELTVESEMPIESEVEPPKPTEIEGEPVATEQPSVVVATDSVPSTEELVSVAAEEAPAQEQNEHPLPAITTTTEQPMDVEPIPDDLSEISDSDDEILDKEEEIKIPTETIGDPSGDNAENHDGNSLKDTATDDSKPEAVDDDLLDFEEISDGELEEDSRMKGVGDALGVDWASLVKEAKIPISPPSEQTTAKQKWQAHRIILDVGISMKMAGEDFAKRLLTDAKAKLDEERGEDKDLKPEIKAEPSEDLPTEEEEEDKKLKLDLDVPTDEVVDVKGFNVDRLPQTACAQVGERVKQAERQNLIVGACGPNSRALSARHDLKLRRQLCGLPVQEYDFRRPVSQKIKATALALFQKTMEVK